MPFELLLAATAFGAASCVAPLGPGYTIENQQVQVRFDPSPEPRIRIEADYQLKNTGNQPLRELELRLPGRRRFHYEEPHATWDGAALTFQISTETPRNTQFAFPAPWAISSRHTLHLSVQYLPANPDETGLSFSSDAFFLPAQGWSPEFLAARSLFGTGGVPPKKWDLLVHVPEGFLVHTSGQQAKSSRSGGELVIRATQTVKDRYPFVIAGRYKEEQTDTGKGKICLWTKRAQEPKELREAREVIARTSEAYDAVFGTRSKESSATWIVECPAATGCFTNLTAATARLLGEDEKDPTTAEMVSPDTMMVDLSKGALRVPAAAPALASSWLGYGQNPGFYEQEPPLSVLPAFAASISREAAEGGDARRETIRRVLRLIPVKSPSREEEGAEVMRAKSFLFFYALQDQYGKETFRKAVAHMLKARRGRGLELSDLIAAFEEETHQNVAEFVRLWMKRPGVPEEFRARYAGVAATNTSKETKP